MHIGRRVREVCASPLSHTDSSHLQWSFDSEAILCSI